MLIGTIGPPFAGIARIESPTFESNRTNCGPQAPSEAPLASLTSWIGPPAAGTRLNLPSAKYPSDLESGDQKGRPEAAVPAST